MYFSSAWAIDLTLFEQDFLRGKGRRILDDVGGAVHEPLLLLRLGSFFCFTSSASRFFSKTQFLKKILDKYELLGLMCKYHNKLAMLIS